MIRIFLVSRKCKQVHNITFFFASNHCQTFDSTSKRQLCRGTPGIASIDNFDSDNAESFEMIVIPIEKASGRSTRFRVFSSLLSG
mmetsp:Transcript_35933/g.36375  ORF Transcript_35933/g.36375 Transcript_35933/m.36375 type:complete len:85 (+) Transcript_35933:475-729(+)